MCNEPRIMDREGYLHVHAKASLCLSTYVINGCLLLHKMHPLKGGTPSECRQQLLTTFCDVRFHTWASVRATLVDATTRDIVCKIHRLFRVVDYTPAVSLTDQTSKHN